jgi:hypothetical protein
LPLEVRLGGNALTARGAVPVLEALRLRAPADLRVLDLGHNRIGRDGCAAVARMLASGVPLLRELELRGNALGNRQAATVCGAVLGSARCRLAHLGLADNNITTAGCSCSYLPGAAGAAGAAGATVCPHHTLARLVAHYPHLRHLDLGWNQISRGQVGHH